MIDEVLHYLPYVVGVAGLVFGILRWRAAQGLNRLVASLGARLTELTRILLVLETRIRQQLPEGTAELADAVTRSSGRGARLDSNVIPQRLAAAIASLPLRERLLITLRYYEGLTFDEIGDLFGMSEEDVVRINAEALEHLRQTLDAAETEPQR
jgi:DNA-directed RNA polymerase specialized sigma subunit